MNEFVVCGRCSFFLSGFRVIHGADALAAVAEEEHEGWLVLPWNLATCRLLEKSYGFEIDDSCSHFEGCCPECRRCFVFSKEVAEGDPHLFQVELKHP